MNKEIKCFIAEQVGEVFLAGATFIALKKTVFPKCSTGEQLVVTLGSTIGVWAVSRSVAKKWFKFCDDMFDTEFDDIIKSL